MIRTSTPATLLPAACTRQIRGARMTTTTGGITGIWFGVRARVQH